SPTSLVFTPANGGTPQFVTVTGVDDKDKDGPQSYKIVTGTVMTTDADYAGLDPEDLDAVNADNEFVFVPAHAVNGALPCFAGGDGHTIAVDEVGTLYVAMSCQDPSGSAGAGGSVGGGSRSGSGGSTGSSGGAVAPADAAVAIPPPP